MLAYLTECYKKCETLVKVVNKIVGCFTSCWLFYKALMTYKINLMFLKPYQNNRIYEVGIIIYNNLVLVDRFLSFLTK